MNADLQLLKQQLDAVLNMPAESMKTMTHKENADYRATYGSYDFIIGDFAITNLKTRSVPNPDWIKA